MPLVGSNTYWSCSISTLPGALSCNSGELMMMMMMMMMMKCCITLVLNGFAKLARVVCCIQARPMLARRGRTTLVMRVLLV